MSSWLLRLNDRVQGEHLTSQSSWTAAWLYLFGLPTCFLCHPMIELMRSCGSADVQIALIKSQNARGASHQPGFMVSCLTIGMVGYHFHCISWLALFFSTFPPPLWPPFSMTQLKQFCGCHHSWLHWQNYSDPTPTFLQPFTWFRLCQSSKDNVPGYILSLAYILAAWWAKTCEDVVDFRHSQKQMPWIRKPGYYKQQPLMNISMVWMATASALCLLCQLHIDCNN